MKYWRWRRKLFNRFRSEYDEQTWFRQRLRDLMEEPMVVKGLSFSPEGRWTYPQLRWVYRILQPELNRIGLGLRTIEITTHGDSVHWYLVQVICLKHDNVIEPNSACTLCMKTYRGR